jgi:hypothetical protein
MSGRPTIKINHLNGQLGRITPTKDGVAGLILSGTAVLGMALTTPKQIFSLKGAEDLGMTAINNPFAYSEVADFYKKAGTGAELWLMLIADTTLLADVCNKNNNIARKLLDTADGTIRLLGINRKLPVGYTISNTACVDTDILQAKINLHELITEYRIAHKPLRAILPHLGFDNTKTGALYNFRQDTHNTIGIISWSAYTTGQPAIAHALGKLTTIPVQRNLGRVKDGDEGVLNAYFPDGTPVKSLESQWDALYDKGLIFLVKHYGRSGFFFVDDSTCAPLEDDYSQLSNGRTIDKAHVLAYNVLSNELLDEVEINDDGTLPASVTGYFQNEVENAIRAQMKNEISGVSAYVDPNQNVLSTSALNLRIKVRPKGQLKDIEADLSFDNPFNS